MAKAKSGFHLVEMHQNLLFKQSTLEAAKSQVFHYYDMCILNPFFNTEGAHQSFHSK